MQELEKIIEKMKEIKDGNRKEKLYAKYPPNSKDQEVLNAYSQGYEDGTDNFYNATAGIIRKHMNEKVTTNDLISRQALLDDFRNTITENSDTFDWLNMIARQPAVKKDDDWIPVEDGLPENEGVYDVTVIDGTGKKCLVTWQFLSGTYLDNSQTYVDGKHYWASSYNGEPVNKYLSKRVTAWRNRPEPYQ